jgi:hypothetical protein
MFAVPQEVTQWTSLDPADAPHPPTIAAIATITAPNEKSC